MVGWALGLLLASSTRPISAIPAQSPFSWSTVQDSDKRRPAALDEKLLGISKEPSSISLVAFHDERPYGGVADATAWLVRYSHVPVPAPDGGAPAEVTVFVAFHSTSNEILAAFTEAAPIWPKSGWTSDAIAKRAATSWELFPPQVSTLQSSVVDVLRHAWKEAGGNPTQGGQITLRPRQFLRKVTIRDASGKPIPQSKANGWVVEILGKKIAANPAGGPVCTQVYVYRDGDFEFSGGLQL